MITGGKAEVKAKFNPSQITLSRAVNWQPQKGANQESVNQQHSNTEPRKLGFDLFFDSFEDGENASVHDDIFNVLSFTEIATASDDHRPQGWVRE